MHGTFTIACTENIVDDRQSMHRLEGVQGLSHTHCPAT